MAGVETDDGLNLRLAIRGLNLVRNQVGQQIRVGPPFSDRNRRLAEIASELDDIKRRLEKEV